MGFSIESCSCLEQDDGLLSVHGITDPYYGVFRFLNDCDVIREVILNLSGESDPDGTLQRFDAPLMLRIELLTLPFPSLCRD